MELTDILDCFPLFVCSPAGIGDMERADLKDLNDGRKSFLNGKACIERSRFTKASPTQHIGREPEVIEAKPPMLNGLQATGHFTTSP